MIKYPLQVLNLGKWLSSVSMMSTNMCILEEVRLLGKFRLSKLLRLIETLIITILDSYEIIVIRL
jgi:hypothetical protein